MSRFPLLLLSSLCLCVSVVNLPAAETKPKIDTRRGDAMIAKYFAAETAKLEGGIINEIKTKEDWLGRQDELRRQLHEMLGLDPLPERTPLNPVVTGTIEHAEFTVEKLHFQSRPRLYVTANLYVPKNLTKPAPAVLYVCGHGNERNDGRSLGSKTKYQHHGAWLARQGYVCLILDTLQLAEIEGLHHGTYHKDMFWWYSRGYTPAGVEAWNGIRAIDYLQSRKEVDPERIGVTGRSGGGASSWWIAALDERIKAAVPVAGITDLRNHVVDGVIEGHCDCMFQVNTYGWDYGTVAALIAPRPLLLTNTDDDRIFPLDGVERVHWQTKKIYGLLGAHKDLGLQISWGGHLDTQELQVAALRWFNLHLKKEDPKIEIAAVKMFEPEQLTVFDKLPEDELNTSAHLWFVPTVARPKVPADASEWATMRDGWRKSLDEKVFHGWPKEELIVDERRVRNNEFASTTVDFSTSGVFQLSAAALFSKEGAPASHVRLIVTGDSGKGWTGYPALESSSGMFTVRGTSDSIWDQTSKKQTQHQRRHMLLGQTLAGQQVYDVRRAIQALHTVPELKDAKVTLTAEGPMAALCVYAALYEPSVDRLVLKNMPASHMPPEAESKDYAPALLNVLKYLDLPQAVALAAERATIEIHDEEPAKWRYPSDVAKALGWEGRVEVKRDPTKGSGR